MSGQFAYNQQRERVEIMEMKFEGINVKSLLEVTLHSFHCRRRHVANTTK